RMPALRRADAPAHDPAPTTHPRGAGNGATSHNEPAPNNEPTRPSERSAMAPDTFRAASAAVHPKKETEP
ncbi:hypothetical protein ABT032_39985, partial [Streptomyces flaveus]